MNKLVQIDDDFINQNTIFSELILKIKKGFGTKSIIVPLRHHHDFPNPEVESDSTVLLMPAWNPGKDGGVKIVSISPENAKFGLPSIQGVYILMDTIKGGVKAILEAKSLTAKRTAATSALASSYLSRENASTLLMIGTGALSLNLIKAHASVRPIKNVFVWGRSLERAQGVCENLKNEEFKISTVSSIKEKIADVDIISCATLSKSPLVLGRYLQAGQHIDLVGAYKKDMREADDEVVKKASVFVDTLQGGLKESGDIVIPLKNGTLKTEDIKADLFGLCSGSQAGRVAEQEITVFKSVGHAIEDLVAATYYYNKFMNE
ncbi:MAG: ornithine cyclodeaminase family protein [Maribacter sp.]|nr:ornithine cyclodeaminase family protein [Maribacter sp.]